MLSNYLKIAWRNLSRNKIFSTINILGLSLGIAVVLLIIVFIKHEFSYDQFVTDKENVYRVFRYWSEGDGKTAWTPSRLAEKMKADFPEVKAASGLSPSGEQLLEYGTDKVYIKETASVDSSFFQTLALPFKHGDPSRALNQPDAVVISDRLASRFFGETNPIGEVIKIGGEQEYQISGVVALEDKNTHVDYDIFWRFEWYADSWTGNNRATYVRLHNKADKVGLEKRLTASMKVLIEKEYLATNYTPGAEDFPDWRLQSLSDIYLHSSDVGWISSKEGNIRNIYIFSLIASLLLFIAIVNYVNLATAQATKRAKEVGIRKTTGALRSQLTTQFMTEAFLQSSLAALLALMLAEALLPFFNTVTNRELELLGDFSFWILIPVIGLIFITALLSGFYPALVLSRFKPVLALRSNFLKTGENGGLRKLLVTGQFTITIALLVFMAFIYRQVNFMMDHELGFKPDQVVVIPLNNRTAHYKIESLRSVFQSIPGVKNVTTASRLPGQFFPDWGMMIEGREENVGPYVLFTDADYNETLGLDLVKGRFLSSEIASDTIDNFVVNESFIKRYNIDKPIGKKVKFTFSKQYGRIVGVVKDFHFQGLQRQIAPLVINGQHRRWNAAIQLSSTNLSHTIFEIEKLWKQIEQEHPMRYSFLDEDFAKQYAEQGRFGKTMLYATILTLFIAILGLFGLTVFNVERRTKEIGIRKVLGASIAGIVSLLLKDFLKWVGLAVLIAIPIGWYTTNWWLQDFAFRTDISWWVFLMAGVLALLVAVLSMGFQSIRAALANPVESLRSE